MAVTGKCKSVWRISKSAQSIFRGWVTYVMIASTTKLVPPAKSVECQNEAKKREIEDLLVPVNLSNLKEKAIEKKNS